VTLIWMLTNLLYLPGIDYVRSYRQPASEIARIVNEEPACVIAKNLGEPQRAMFDYFERLRFVAPTSAATSQCAWLLIQGTKAQAPEVESEWQLRWEGARPADRVEQFRLYVKTTKP